MSNPDNNKSHIFHSAVKKVLSPQPIKFTVNLDSTKLIYPKQLHNSKSQTGLDISGYNTVLITWKTFGTGVEMTFLKKPEIKFGKIVSTSFKSQYLSDADMFRNPMHWDISGETELEQLLFMLINANSTSKAEFDVELVYTPEDKMPAAIYRL